MRDRELDDILKQAADAKPDVDPALLARISKSLGSNLQPAVTMPAPWILAGSLMLLGMTLALAAAMLLGARGFQKMSGLEIGVIFSVLAILISLASAQAVAAAIPGSKRPIAPWVLQILSCIGLAVIFSLLFHDYGTERFVSQGIRCLIAGLVVALPVSLAAWLVLKRGYSVNPSASGLARGTLAGLAGVAMLELHCANFETPHLIVWHLAVVPISGVVGVWIARKQMSHH